MEGPCQTPISSRDGPHKADDEREAEGASGRGVNIEPPPHHHHRPGGSGAGVAGLQQHDEYYEGLKTYESAALDALLAACANKPPPSASPDAV